MTALPPPRSLFSISRHSPRDSFARETGRDRVALDSFSPWLESHSQGASSTEMQELRELARETDPRLFSEGLLSVAGRLERSESSQAIVLAANLYSFLDQAHLPLAERGRARLAVLNGGGAWSERAEGLLRSFARQASDPAMLAGMGLASGVFTLTRTAMLSRLLAAPGSAFLTRGFGARALASAAGFALEAPTFTLATRLANEGLGRPQDWSRSAVHRDIASSYLVLGALKLTHWGAGEALGNRAREGVLPARVWQGATQQLATFGGIWLGHGLEGFAGLRRPQDPALTLVDSLAMLFQFQVAGRLSAGMMGRPFAEMERGVDRYSRSPAGSFIQTAENSFSWPIEGGLRPAFATAEISNASVSESEAPAPRPGTILAMSVLGADGRGARPSLGGRFDQLVRPTFSEKSVSPAPRHAKGERRPVRRIGILTSGGDGPGENAAIEALVRGAIQVHGWEPLGIFDGYRGLLEPEGRIQELLLEDVAGEAAVRSALKRLYAGRTPAGLAEGHADISSLGGDLLRSSRTNPVQGDPSASRVKRTMREHGIDAVVVLGGNGSMRAAEALRRAGVPLVGIPQSIDLDVWGSEHSIGFPSAVAKGAAEVHHFHNTAHSCDRWFLVEVMGQHYGMLTLAVGRESRTADSVFIEVPRPLSEVREVIERVRPTRSHGVLLFSEGVKFRGEGVSVIEPPRGTDIHGRMVVESGDVVRWLRRPLAEMGIVHTRPESLGYLLRGADPTPHEIALARILSEGALRLVEGGHFGRMVGTGFAGDSSDLHLVYPRLTRVASHQKSAPENYFRYVRALLEGGEG
ncbi:MAG: 6-phosphofructokinase [Deltaproteobacteria bacterium]|nr:6-phosphofructokinase [Deltaproteobacteria bacterium]